MEKSGIYVECFLQIRMSIKAALMSMQHSGTFTCSRKLLAKELSHNGGYRGPDIVFMININSSNPILIGHPINGDFKGQNFPMTAKIKR